MRIIVTRPEPDAATQAEALRALGHEVIVAPLLVTQLRGVATSALISAAAIAVTSRNALRALEGTPAYQLARPLPLYCVGPGTAELARKMKFTQVIEAGGDAESLAQLLRTAQLPAEGAIVHLAGEKLAYDLVADLRAAGRDARSLVTYFVSEAASLGDKAEAAIGTRQAEGIILMSPHTAETYVRLVSKAGLGEAARGLVHFCLSDNVAAALTPMSPSRVATATRPRNEEIIALVTRVATGRL
jgi:uroporphyrinogen-III synthase